jgi:predicted ArsR family transcriptional regulator
LLNGEAAVDSLASSGGIHRTVARRHMRDLLAAGFVASRPARGSRGRPRTVYSITTLGREVFGARYDVLLDCLARGSLRQTGLRGARRLFTGAAKTLAEDLSLPGSPDFAMAALRNVGFQPELRAEGRRKLIISHQCPVFRQAQKTPDLLCRSFHSRLLNEAFQGMKVELVETMAKGSPRCVHALIPRSRAAVARTPKASKRLPA